MNSLEALEELSLMINREKHINSEWNKKINDLIQTIKQDLERSKHLEKEIAELKDQIAYLKDENEDLQSTYEWSQAKNSILKLKNQELEEEKEHLKNDIELNEAQIDDLTLEVANYKHALEEKNEIIMDLKEENQELLVNKNLAQGIALKYKKGLEKAIKEHKLKSIQFKEKGEVQNSMLFNQIACILEGVLKG